MKKKSLVFFVLLLIFVALAGCGDPKVTGKVTFPDGSPLTAGQVMFQSEGFIGSGNIQSDGTYSAGKLKDGDGLPPGKYQVFITGAVAYDESDLELQSAEVVIGQRPMFKTPIPTVLISSKYQAPKSSGLTVDVNGRTKYDITVEKP